MPAAMPADLAERLSDVPEVVVGSQELDAAREEMIERLLEGKQVGRVTFTDLLDCAINENVRSVVEEVAGHLLAINDYAMDEHTHVERRRNLDKWMRGMVERWVDSHPDQIQERAEEMAADEGEEE